MFANAQKVSAFGVDVLIPTPEDFLTLMINNAYHNIAVQPPVHMGAYYQFFDCARIIEDNKNLNWDTVFEIASQSGILYRIRVYLELFNWALPSFLPEGLLAKIPVDEESMNKSIEKDILFKVNDRLFIQQKGSKLSECKNLSDVVFALKVRLGRVLFYVVRKVTILSLMDQLYKGEFPVGVLSGQLPLCSLEFVPLPLASLSDFEKKLGK